MSEKVMINDEVYYEPDDLEIESLEYVFELCSFRAGWEDYPSLFWNRVCRDEIGAPFSREKFLHNDDIIATLEGFELDAEKFWWVILFIFDWTMTKFHDCMAVKTPLDSLQEICDYIGNGDKLEIAFRKKGRKGKDADPNIKRVVVESLHAALKREQEKHPNYVCGHIGFRPFHDELR